MEVVIVFSNQSVEDSKTFLVYRESKSYYWVKGKMDNFRIHKKTLKTLHIRENYQFKGVKALLLIPKT